MLRFARMCEMYGVSRGYGEVPSFREIVHFEVYCGERNSLLVPGF